MHQRYYCANKTAACTVSNASDAYSYDGEGNRIQKLTAGVTTNYVYDAFGQLAAEYTTGGPAQTAGRFFRTTDHLGSTRLVTNSAGGVVSRRDSFPFGEQILANASSGRTSANLYNTAMGFPQLFTGKERDVESGLDYFLARYYSAGLGRFTGSDPNFQSALIEVPQTWNRYAYVLDNPFKFTDDSGELPHLAVAGIVGGVSGAISAGATAYSQYSQTGQVSGRDVGAAFAGGFVAGFATTATLGIPALAGVSVLTVEGLGLTATVGASANILGGTLSRSIDSPSARTEPLTSNDVLLDAITGSGGAVIGSMSRVLAVRDLSPLRPRVRLNRLAAYRAAQANYRSGVETARKIGDAVEAGIGSGLSGGLRPLLEGSYSTFGFEPRPVVNSSIRYVQPPEDEQDAQ